MCHHRRGRTADREAIISKLTTLYRMFDGSKRLLYAGISGHLPARLSQHRGDKDWWTSVDHITLEHFDDRDAALLAEAEAIKVEKPIYNRTPGAAVKSDLGEGNASGIETYDHGDIRQLPEYRRAWQALDDFANAITEHGTSTSQKQ